MRNLMIVVVLICGLVFVPKPAFTQTLQYADIYITPETNPNFFSGYVGGDGDTSSNEWIDWSIGNGTLFNSIGEDDLIFSTCIGNFGIANNWIERMRITEAGNIGIGTASPTVRLDVVGTVRATAFVGDGSGLTGIVSSYTETDPIYSISTAAGITPLQLTNWNAAYGWGDHSTAGYLTNYTEIDPLVGANTTNYLSKWDGSALVSGSIFDNGSVGIGTASPATKLDVNGTVTATAFVGDGSGLTGTSTGIPTGGIIMWSGQIASIPSGWALCDGTNGTLDLQDRFIVGAGSSYSVNNTGGSTSHNHGGNTGSHTLTTSEMPAHHHETESTDPGVPFGRGSFQTGIHGAANVSDNTALTSNTGGGAGHTHIVSSTSSLPPYYALAYIMKL